MMPPELTYLATGAVIGLGAGATPGPLTMLVITQTLKHDLKEGAKVAIAPIITDVPIILVSALLFAKFSQVNLLLAAISFVGSMFLVLLAKENFTTRAVTVGLAQPAPQSLLKGVVTNLLCPHPYIFWISVGTPIIARAMLASFPSAVAFVVGMLGAMVGIKLILALSIRRWSGFLRGRPYLMLLRASGIALLAFAGMFLLDGLRQLGVIS